MNHLPAWLIDQLEKDKLEKQQQEDDNRPRIQIEIPDEQQRRPARETPARHIEINLYGDRRH